MSLQDKIKVMQAYQDGKSVEVRNKAGQQWSLETKPVWNWWECEYRIRKEDETPRMREPLENNKGLSFGLNSIMPETSPNKIFDDMTTRLLDNTVKQEDISGWRDIHCRIINALLSKHDDIDTINDRATKLMMHMMMFERMVTKNPHAFDVPNNKTDA